MGAQRQAEIMRSVGAPKQDRSTAAEEIADAVARELVGLPLSNMANRQWVIGTVARWMSNAARIVGEQRGVSGGTTRGKNRKCPP